MPLPTIPVPNFSGASVVVNTLPNAGQQTSAESLPFVLASDLVAKTVTGNITTQNLVPAGAATANSSVELTCQNFGVATVQVTGTYTGALSGQVTVDGVNWVTLANTNFQLITTGACVSTIASASVGIWKMDLSGFLKIRISALAAVTGTAVVTVNGVAGSGHPLVDSNNQFTNGVVTTVNKGGSGTGTARVSAAASAHSSTSTENPVLVGGFVTSTIETTLVQGDVAQHAISTAGQLIGIMNATSENKWFYAAAASGIVNSTAGVTVKAAGAANVKNYVTGLDLTWDALGAATEFVIRDGASGTVIYRTKLGIAAGSKTVQFADALKGTAATLVEVATLTASVTGGVFANLTGYQAF